MKSKAGWSGGESNLNPASSSLVFFVVQMETGAVRDCRLLVLLQKSKLPDMGRWRKEEERVARVSAVEQVA